LARRQIEYGRQVGTSAVAQALDRLDRILSEQMEAKQKAESAQDMAKEVALLNLYTNDFVNKRNEAHEVRKAIIQEGGKLPAWDKTAGFTDALQLVDEVDEMEVEDMAAAVDQTTRNVEYLYGVHSSLLAGKQARKQAALEQEDFSLTGGIDISDPDSVLYLDEYGGLPEDIKGKLADDENFRLGFEKGKLSTVEIQDYRARNAQIVSAEDAIRRGQINDAQKITNLIASDIGQDIAPNLTIGGLNLLQIQGLSGEDLEEYFKQIEELANKPIDEGGSPTLANKVLGLVQSLNRKPTATGENPYLPIMSEISQTYDLNERYKNLVQSYAIRNNMDWHTAKDALLTKTNLASEEDMALSEEVLALFNEVRERQNVGLWMDPARMQQAYKVENMQNAIYMGELDRFTNLTGTPDAAMLDVFNSEKQEGKSDFDILNQMTSEYIWPNLYEDDLGANMRGFKHELQDGIFVDLKYEHETFSEEEIMDEMNLIIDSRGLGSFNLDMQAMSDIRNQAIQKLEQVNVDNKNRAINQAESERSNASLSRQLEKMQEQPGSFMGPGIY
jgi:hypothetical protein